MARVVIMRTALGSGKYAVGDVVDVFADGASVGKRVLLNEWEAALKFNLDSFFICSKTVGEVMVQQKAGNIINMGSVAGLGPFPGMLLME